MANLCETIHELVYANKSQNGIFSFFGDLEVLKDFLMVLNTDV